MSTSLFAFLDQAPSLDEIAAEFSRMGLHYRHTLPPDTRWNYPMHVFGTGDLRVVYHAGNPEAAQAVVDTTVRRGDTSVEITQLHLISRRVIQRWGGKVYDPHIEHRIQLS
jgi:hypothetical protein